MKQSMIYRLIAIIAFFMIFASCVTKTEETKQEGHHEEAPNTVEFTDEQYKVANVTLGNVEMKALSGAIKVNGMLDVPPQNLVSVSAPMGGFVKSTELLQGLKVKKSKVIAVIQNAEDIQIQKAKGKKKIHLTISS